MSASLIARASKSWLRRTPQRRRDLRKQEEAPRKVPERGQEIDVLVTSCFSEALLETAANSQIGEAHQIVVKRAVAHPVKEEARKLPPHRVIYWMHCERHGSAARAKDLVVYASGERKSYRQVSPVLDGFRRAPIISWRVQCGAQK